MALATLEAILQAIDELTAEEKQKVVAHIQHTYELDPSEAPKERVFDLHPGSMWVSDDFDNELPDSFWFGEDA